jgi:hypothetical protein
MRFQSLLRGLPVLLLLSGCAFSAPITITFTSSLLTAFRDQTVTFTATVTNTTAASLFLNSDALNITAPLIPDDTKFFLNFPLSLAAGQMVTAPVLDISVPLNAPFALYPGEFDILGGSDANAQSTIGTATFAVNVATPEPETFGSAIIGLGCVILFLRRKRHGIL